MKKIICSILIASFFVACETPTEPSPAPSHTPSSGTGSGTGSGTTTTPTDVILAELPEGLPKATDCIIADLQFDISGTVNDKLIYTLTYDKYNRIVKSVTNSTQYPNTTTYVYEKGKIKITQDASFFSGLKSNNIINYTLDDKNRVSVSESTVKATYNGTESVSTTKVSYKYDANGYLEETKSEDNNKKTLTTKYKWEGGNLVKTEVIDYNEPGTKYEKWTNVTTYEFDKSKTNGSWDVNSVSGAAVAPGIAYFGKTNKNIISKLQTINDWVITTPVSLNAKLTVDTDYKYTFDGKGYPATFDVNTNAKAEGSFPVSVPPTNVKGTVKYKCN